MLDALSTHAPPRLTRLTLSHVSPMQCSVSCGVGTQRRTQVCQRLTAKGQRVPLSEASCRGLPGPALVRPCHMPVCSSKYVRSPLHGVLSLVVVSRRPRFPDSSTFISCGSSKPSRSQNSSKQQAVQCGGKSVLGTVHTRSECVWTSTSSNRTPPLDHDKFLLVYDLRPARERT